MKMGYIESKCPGRTYKNCLIDGHGYVGQVVMVCGNNRVTVNTDPMIRSFGILMGDYKDGEYAGIYFMGGIYRTNVFNGWAEPGDFLKVGANGKLTSNFYKNETNVFNDETNVFNGLVEPGDVLKKVGANSKLTSQNFFDEEEMIAQTISSGDEWLTFQLLI